MHSCAHHLRSSFGRCRHSQQCVACRGHSADHGNLREPPYPLRSGRRRIGASGSRAGERPARASRWRHVEPPHVCHIAFEIAIIVQATAPFLLSLIGPICVFCVHLPLSALILSRLYTNSAAAGIVTPARASTSSTPEGSTLVIEPYLSPPGFGQTSTPSVVRSTIQNSGIPARAITRKMSPGRGCAVGYPRQSRLTRTMSGCGSVASSRRCRGTGWRLQTSVRPVSIVEVPSASPSAAASKFYQPNERPPRVNGCLHCRPEPLLA
jgi:hypothetical protein